MDAAAAATPLPPVRDEVSALAEQIRDVAGQLIRRVRRESGTTLTWSQSVLLSGLARLGEATVSELAAENGLKPQTVWSSLSLLEDRGYVDRRRDLRDRRHVQLRLTALGRRELAADRHVRERWIVGALSAEFSEDHRRVLAEAAPLLAQLAASSWVEPEALSAG